LSVVRHQPSSFFTRNTYWLPASSIRRSFNNLNATQSRYT